MSVIQTAKKTISKIDNKLTYEEVLEGIYRNKPDNLNTEKSWNYHVDLARRLLSQTYFNRMAIAEIAIQASVIKNGGDRHSKQFKETFSLLTITSFAEAIGMNKSTLALWVSIKRTVFDRLSEEEQHTFKHNAGEQTFRALENRKKVEPEVIVKTYDKFLHISKKDKQKMRALKYVQSLQKLFTKQEHWKDMTESQLEAISMGLRNCLSAILRIEKLHKQKRL